MAAPVRLCLSIPALCPFRPPPGVRGLAVAAANLPRLTDRHQQGSLCGASVPLVQTVRHTNFFNKLTAEQLWKGVTSVSNAGKKQGRGKGVGKKVAKNLNRGQVIGVGKENMVWPGLNSPVLRGRELVQQQLLPKDEEREAKLIKIRESEGKFRTLKIDPIERGWSGTKMPGRSIGPPDPIGEDNFEGFDTKVLEFKIVTHMTAAFGRKRRVSIFAVTGNGNGLAGFALSKATAPNDAIRKVKNKAGQKLLHIPLYNDHTVLHDFFTEYHKTKIFVKKMPEGYGLVCHRAIRTICEVVGIKDLHAKVEGPCNVQNITKAFFLGLTSQKSYQQMANERQLYVVEFRKECMNYPKVLAAPENGKVRTLNEIPEDEDLDFTRYVLGGRVPLERKKYPPGYTKLYSYEIYLKSYAKRRNMDKVKLDMMVHHGEVRSFYTDEYPECRPPQPRSPKEMEEEEEATA